MSRLLAVLLLCLVTTTARAGGLRPEVPAEARTAIRASLGQACFLGVRVPLLGTNVPHFTRQLASGAERLVIEASTPDQLRAVQKALHGNGLPVLELMRKIVDLDGKRVGQEHTKAIVQGQGWHAVHPGFRTEPQDMSTWFLERWGLDLTFEHESTAVLLSDGKAQQLHGHVAQLARAGVMTHPEGENPYNCAAVWTKAPIGERGETLREMLGFSSRLDVANTGQLHRALEFGGNDRILATILYRPAQADFGQQPNRRLFH